MRSDNGNCTCSTVQRQSAPLSAVRLIVSQKQRVVGTKWQMKKLDLEGKFLKNY